MISHLPAYPFVHRYLAAATSNPTTSLNVRRYHLLSLCVFKLRLIHSVAITLLHNLCLLLVLDLLPSGTRILSITSTM